MKRMWVLLPAIALAGGCSLLPGAGSGCDKPKPYQAAEEAPPLRVPDGAVLPDTHNAMRIPQVSAPQLPRDGGRCLDQPPSMGAPGPAKG